MNFSRGAQISMALSPPKGPASSQGLKLQCVNFGGGEFIGITARVSVNLLILILLQLCKKMLQCGNLGGEYQGFAKKQFLAIIIQVQQFHTKRVGTCVGFREKQWERKFTFCLDLQRERGMR